MNADPPRTHRRDFLVGKSATEALVHRVQPADSEEHGQTVAGAESPRSYSVHVSRRAMACEFETILHAGQYDDGLATALAALDLVEELEDQLTIYRDHSELSGINRQAAVSAVQAEAGLFQLLQLCMELHDETDGAFDVSSGPLSKVWGFYRRQGRLPDAHSVEQALAYVGSQHLELDAENQSVEFLVPGMEINLGAIGKGYALDRCGDLFADADIEHFLMHAGQSSLLAGGGGEEASFKWRIGITHPLRPGQRLGELHVAGCGVGTSGAGVQFFYHRGKRYGHILDPRTGWPAEKTLSTTVLAPTAARADALATAFFIMGPDQAEAYCAAHPEVRALLILPLERQGALKAVNLGIPDEDLQVVT